VTSPRLVAVVPLVFNGQGCVGDFAWMFEVAPEVCGYIYNELCGLGDAGQEQYQQYVENAYDER
jgi:hypothetical protein